MCFGHTCTRSLQRSGEVCVTLHQRNNNELVDYLALRSEMASTNRFKKLCVNLSPSNNLASSCPRFILKKISVEFQIEKWDLMFATWFLLGASAKWSSLGTQGTWRRTDSHGHDKRSEPSQFTPIISRTLRGNDRKTKSRPCCRTRRAGGYSWTPQRHISNSRISGGCCQGAEQPIVNKDSCKMNGAPNTDVSQSRNLEAPQLPRH